MFNTQLLEVKEAKAYANLKQNDSFSSGSDQEDYVNHRSCHHHSHHSKRKGISPQRAISSEYAITVDQKAKAGIFVVDPFHCRINVEFLKAFAEHHTTQPLFLSAKQGGTYFSSGSEDDEMPTPDDLSYMGFTTGSSSEDEHCSSGNFDFWDTTAKQPSPTKNKKSSRNGNGSAKKVKSTTFSGVNSAKIVNSSSLPRPADNSHKFPVNLSLEAVLQLASKVNSHYKSYPQNHRHGSTPMDISSCPGVQLLTEDEFIACSLLRIRPALYFHARNTLLHNYHHSVGYFRKSAAQKMLRIDVNKTGKLYDFLVRQNWIPEVEGGDCRPEPEQIIVDDPETYHQL